MGLFGGSFGKGLSKTFGGGGLFGGGNSMGGNLGLLGSLLGGGQQEEDDPQYVDRVAMLRQMLARQQQGPQIDPRMAGHFGRDMLRNSPYMRG
jgi:hypothetical protein